MSTGGSSAEAVRRSIDDLARERGLADCRVAPVGEIPHAGVFREWLASGRHGEMGWIERTADVRLDPRERFDWARSVVTVARTHAAPPDPPPADEEDGPRGRVAAYALGRDYHKVLEADLKAVAAAIREHRPEARVRWYVDHGPVADREQGWLGGLGTYGKNTLLLRRDLGTYFLVGVLFTSLDLPPDERLETDLCRGCTACLDACPTEALRGPRDMDARRCISYLTIELDGDLPRGLRADMGEWVFGCDLCQTACPWNADRPDEVDPAPAAEPVPAAAEVPGEMAWPDLLEALELDEEAFRDRYAGSPVMRAKREGFCRNVCVALGNAGDPSAIPALARSLASDPSPVVRSHAAWALGRLGGPGAREALEASTDDPEDTVREEARQALDALGGTPS